MEDRRTKSIKYQYNEILNISLYSNISIANFAIEKIGRLIIIAFYRNFRWNFHEKWCKKEYILADTLSSKILMLKIGKWIIIIF